MKEPLNVLLVAVVAGSIGLIYCFGRDNQVAAHDVQTNTVHQVDADLIALARELRDLEKTPPAPVVRQPHQAEERSRAPLPNVAPAVYPAASGEWVMKAELPGQPQLVKVQRFARDAQRFALETTVNGVREEEAWLFERNPVAPLMGSASTSYYAESVVVDVAWPDLIDRGFGPTWNDVIALGVTEAQLAGLEPTGTTEFAFGHSFGVLAGFGWEIVWSDALYLQLRVTRTDGLVRESAELVDLKLVRDAEALRAPYEVHPDWERMDISDWREEHHETH